ncbi:hypothetical protein ASC89_12790 [Devosia sp. Root413D1]|nr:hypothetical protein ASC89_12790 [Devosia sp. Root413D1]
MTAFFVCYGLTVLLGNLIYATPFGVGLLTAAGYPTSFLQFPTTFTFGYWALLLLPLVAMPVIVALSSPILLRPIGGFFRLVPRFSILDFVVISLVTYGVIIFAFYRSEAVGLFLGGASAADAIEARFAMQARLLFPEKVAIHSIMPFLAYYAFVVFLRDRGKFWAVASAMSCVAAFVVLVFLNMKWPVLLFSIGIVASLMMFSQRRFLLMKLLGGSLAMVAIYLLVSAVVFRLAAEPEARPAVSVEQGSTSELGFESASDVAEKVQQVAGSALWNTPFLTAHAINRMAISYPYYYEIFTERGPVCGTLIQQYLPGKKPCHPSYLVYTAIFGADGYEDRGTAPAAPHITAYAFAGWFGAALGLAGMGLLLALFTVGQRSSGPMADTWAVLGVVMGYHLSQVPGDEVILYTTGLIWPVLLILAYSGLRKLKGLFQNGVTQWRRSRNYRDGSVPE